MPRARDLLRSVLAGLDELFARTGVRSWGDQVREVAALERPSAMARAYEVMSQGSAPGTFYDLSISIHNQFPITQLQEPFINELLTTFQSVGLASVNAIRSDGDDAVLGQPTRAVAGEYWLRWQGHDVPNRRRIVVSGVRCKICDSRYLLDSSSDGVAARRWSLTTAPDWIDADRSRELVDAAMDPHHHAETQVERVRVAPAFERLGLPVLRLPYNRPEGAPNDRCRTCGAHSWTTVHWLAVGDPLRLEALPE